MLASKGFRCESRVLIDWKAYMQISKVVARMPEQPPSLKRVRRNIIFALDHVRNFVHAALSIAFFAAFATVRAQAQAVDPGSNISAAVRQAIGGDPLPDVDHPAAYAEFTLHTDDGLSLPGIAYLAAGAGRHPTALLLHGYPGYDGDHDLVSAMRRAGWNVVTFHYRGLWGSAGTFSFAHAIEDAETALATLHDSATDDRLGVDPSRIVIIGHSLGGFIALRVASRHPSDVEAVGTTSAVNLGELASSIKTSAQYRGVLGLLMTNAPVSGATPSTSIAEMQANEKKWNYDNYARQLDHTPVLLVSARDPFAAQNARLGTLLRQTGNTRVDEIGIASDHDFADHRIAMQTAVLTWLLHLR